MKEPDLQEVEKRLISAIEKQRKEVTGYTVLTILCTPAFVVMASVMVFLIFAFLFRLNPDYLLSVSAIYTCLNLFVLSILARLKFVKMMDNKLRLTPKGRDFVFLGIDF